jgi:hypothetical protein
VIGTNRPDALLVIHLKATDSEQRRFTSREIGLLPTKVEEGATVRLDAD